MYYVKEVCNLRFFVVIIWSFLVSTIVSYVLTSMAGEPFNLNHTMILAAFFVVVITILGEFVLKEEKSN